MSKSTTSTQEQDQGLHADRITRLHRQLDAAAEHPEITLDLDAMLIEADAISQAEGGEGAAIRQRVRALQSATLDQLIAEEETTPPRSRDELHMLQLMKDADELICVYANNSSPGNLPGAAEALYSASGHLIETDDDLQKRVGYIMALDAFLASPDALEGAVRTLRQSLVNSDPEIARVYSATLPAPGQPAPLAIVHRINDNDFRLEPDGTLTGFMVQDLAPADVFDLLTFFRMPGVAGLIARAEAERQTATEQEWQAEQHEEMTRERALALLQADDELMRRLARIAAERGVALMQEGKAA